MKYKIYLNYTLLLPKRLTIRTKHLIEGEEFKFKCGKTIKVACNISCDVKNVIYVIVCDGCGNEYIGLWNRGTCESV